MSRVKWMLPRSVFFLGIVVFGGCAWVMGNVAARNTKGLFQDGMFQFAVDAVTLCYWVVFGVSILLALVTVWASVLHIVSKAES